MGKKGNKPTRASGQQCNPSNKANLHPQFIPVYEEHFLLRKKQ